jgi:hypothetical protein
MKASDESLKRVLIVQAACGLVVASVAAPFMFDLETFDVNMLLLIPVTGAVTGVLLPAGWASFYVALTLLRDLMEPLMNADPLPKDQPWTWRESIRRGVRIFVVSSVPYVALLLLLRRMNG